MCDVILPERENPPSDQPTDSAIMFYEEPTSNQTPTDQGSEDDECSNESEHILGDLGDYTLSTKLPKNYKERVKGEEIPVSKGEVSEESSHDAHLDEDSSQEFSISGSSLIEEITESLQDGADHFSCVKDSATFSPSGEVIIEECSIIEEEIIPPEKASTPLSPSVFLKDENVRVATNKITGEPDVRRSADVEPISGKSSQCATNIQTTTKKRPPVSTRAIEIVQDTKSKLRKLQPKVDNVGVAPPVVYRVGNMVLPVSSPLVNTTQVAVQNHSPNSASLMTPQMAYLIPFRGVITAPVAVKSCSNPDKGKPTISGSGQSKSSDSLTKKELATPRRTNQKKRVSRNAGNPITLKTTASASNSIHSRCVDERRKIEKRFSLKLREMKGALRKKDILVKKLIKDNLHLSQKLTILRRAFLTSRKDSVLNRSSSKYLKIG
uniref:Protein L-Myc-1-A n=1 Tax=Lygus hesperus TaxID=30085 RepID=A0A0A9X3H6_LYGHE